MKTKTILSLFIIFTSIGLILSSFIQLNNNEDVPINESYYEKLDLSILYF